MILIKRYKVIYLQTQLIMLGAFIMDVKKSIINPKTLNKGIIYSYHTFIKYNTSCKYHSLDPILTLEEKKWPCCNKIAHS